jgi:pilus assembly protein Flp/PilA
VSHGEESGWSRASAYSIRRLITFKIRAITQALLDERGQDLIEYGLVVALIALAATAGLSKVASSIGDVFSKVGSTLSTHTS